MDKLLNKIKKIIPTSLFRVLQPAYHFLLSWLAAVFYCFPSEKLIVIGITGTTGKTTTVYLLAKILASAGFKVGFTSTAMFNDGRREWLNDKKMTMVGRFFTQRILRQMVKNGCQYAIVETTSEGIRQFRHRFINYDIVLLTCLYPEHIESHGSFEKYRQAKGELFAHLEKCRPKYVNEKKQIIKPTTGLKKIELERIKKKIIVNGDDEHASYFLNFWAEEKIVYSQSDQITDIKDLKVISYGGIKSSVTGTDFKVKNVKISLPLLGSFNAVNAAAAISVGLAEGLSFEIIKSGLKNIKSVPGRLERIDEGQDFTVIVDYAFEPKAVAKLYQTIALLPHKKVIHVFGSAGGGRDAARRPILGQIVGKQADYVIVTNEDPYDDDPEMIISQVALGAEKVGKKIGKNLFKILDRREAIKKALDLARAGDLVLVTGKGSEQAICIAGGEKIPWDDRTVVRNLLRMSNN
jgi:UDP-N-acetylmuramoyl-L-alanyl-D-glutamate--2,6-diaminopimelate ligase